VRQLARLTRRSWLAPGFLRQLDAIDHFEQCPAGGLDDVGADARTAVTAAVVVHVQDRFALRVLTDGHRMDFELAHRHGDAGGQYDGLVGRIDRPVTAGLALKRAPVGVLEPHGGQRAGAAVRLDVEMLQGPRTLRSVLGAQHQRLDVAVEQFLLAVGQRLEFLEHPVDLELIEVEAQLLHPLAKGMPATVFAEHQVAAREAHILGAHDLVGRKMFEHAVLMDAGLMREGILADHRLVARDRLAGNARDQARGRVELRRLHAITDIEERGACLERHHDFLERAVAGALADAVDGALYLTCPTFHPSQRVCNGHAEIVMAVRGVGNFV
jgi:hypothetical protein